jgi:hypothetical protein
VVAGRSGSIGFRWKAGVLLDIVPSSQNTFLPKAVSEDGRVVVGYFGGNDFVWRESVGVRSLADELLARGIEVRNLPSRTQSMFLSNDGKTIVGEVSGTQFWRLVLSD